MSISRAEDHAQNANPELWAHRVRVPSANAIKVKKPSIVVHTKQIAREHFALMTDADGFNAGDG